MDLIHVFLYTLNSLVNMWYLKYEAVVSLISNLSNLQSMTASLYDDGDDDDEIFIPVTIYLIYRMGLHPLYWHVKEDT
jgi:hypothetical protein